MEMSVKLQRPLAVLDLETTGLRPDQDRIVEIAILRIEPDGKQTRLAKRVNPEIPIPPEATAVHGIGDADVKNELAFHQLAPEIGQWLKGCDLAGFNVSGYDLRVLQREFGRAGIEFSITGRAIVDAKQIYHAREPRNLEAACLFYLNEKHENAHSALDDVLATWRVLNAQLSRYEDMPRDPAAIDSIFNRSVDSEGKFEWIHHKAAFTFGKYRGRLLEDVAKIDAEYLTWIVEKGEFRQEVKQIVQKALKGEFPAKAKASAAAG